MKWNDYSKPASKSGTGYQNVFDVKPRGTSLSLSERSRLQTIGKELRTARGQNRARLVAELDELSDSKEFTAADARMIAAYAKAGAMQEQDGYAPGDGHRMLDMVRNATDE
ncbi:hypothetical protein [Yokenella regensburgei]|uniref:hypothetical protein n=1 Tax=Yokenella regensburgei TaxID=158877 RepID=UPI0028A29A55|nr:hypothetical protein [Yokenella regensburgei]